MIVVQPEHLKASLGAVEVYAELAIKMIRAGWFFHHGWQIGFELYDDKGIMRRRMVCLHPGSYER